MGRVTNVVHMNGGNDESSYAKNSSFQQKIMLMTEPIRTKAISDLSSNNLSKTICIADLGCSTGSNALLVTSELVEIVARTRRRLGLELPEVQVFLNDLPGNDFNTVFRLLQEKGSDLGRYHTGVPGSFYDRLFPAESLHFVHSSYSLHWLSQVPEGLDYNKDNICAASTSLTSVREAYQKQFHYDFSMFLKHRAIELVPGGRMVLTLQGRSKGEDGSLMFELLAEAISDMVSEGVIEEQELHSFNVPIYTPSSNELSAIIQEEGSFSIDILETFEISWIAYRNNESSLIDPPLVKDDGLSVMKTMRSVLESQLRHHFHEGILDDMFNRFHKKISDCMAREIPTHTNVIVSMKKKSKMEETTYI